MELIAHRYRVARKDYCCDLCRDTIKKGDKYCYSFIKDGGDYWIHRSHLECEFVSQELWEWINPWDGMHDDEFLEGVQSFCRRMICPNCASWDDEYDECRNDEPYCMSKIVEKLKEFDFCLVKPPECLNLKPSRRYWGFVKKDEPVTKLPRYE